MEFKSVLLHFRSPFKLLDSSVFLLQSHIILCQSNYYYKI